MKKKFVFLLEVMIIASLPLFCEADEEETPVINKPVYERTIPSAKKPGKVSSEKMGEKILTDEKTASEEYLKECRDKFRYGLEDTILELIEELTKNDDYRFSDDIYNLFYVTKSSKVKEKILEYFTKIEDPCLEEFAVTVIFDPFDEKKDIVEKCIAYVGKVNCKEALPGLIDLIDNQDEKYFDAALRCVGEIGGNKEAVYLSELMDLDDLSNSRKQSLMKVLGQLKALDTWDTLADIAQDDDQNTFVRMYAAEAIGAMEKTESRDILIKLYESDDANLRQYVIKGLSHFGDDKTREVIYQALRDSNYKVRLEAIDVVQARKWENAVPYLIYRTKDANEENVVKDKCYPVIAEFNTKEGNEYLVGIITDKKKPDSQKIKVAAALIKYDHAGQKEIYALAEEALKSDKMKPLRYALGKEFAKYGRNDAAEICALYLESKDVQTQGTGLDIWAKGRYSSSKEMVKVIAAEDGEGEGKKKKNANSAKAKRILSQVQ